MPGRLICHLPRHTATIGSMEDVVHGPWPLWFLGAS